VQCFPVGARIDSVFEEMSGHSNAREVVLHVDAGSDATSAVEVTALDLL